MEEHEILLGTADMTDYEYIELQKFKVIEEILKNRVDHKIVIKLLESLKDSEKLLDEREAEAREEQKALDTGDKEVIKKFYDNKSKMFKESLKG